MCALLCMMSINRHKFLFLCSRNTLPKPNCYSCISTEGGNESVYEHKVLLALYSS
jgi:hypothetical protein